MTTADVKKINKLKMTIVSRVNSQLLSLQLGHPYKIDNDIDEAIDLISLLEKCDDVSKYKTLIQYYTDKLIRKTN